MYEYLLHADSYTLTNKILTLYILFARIIMFLYAQQCNMHISDFLFIHDLTALNTVWLPPLPLNWSCELTKKRRRAHHHLTVRHRQAHIPKRQQTSQLQYKHMHHKPQHTLNNYLTDRGTLS